MNTRTLSLAGLTGLMLATTALTGCVTNNARPQGGMYDDRANIPSNQKFLGHSDEAIAQNVRAALRGNTKIRGAEKIEVQVNNGVVTLSGLVSTDEDRIRATRTAEQVSGVRRVRDSTNN